MTAKLTDLVAPTKLEKQKELVINHRIGLDVLPEEVVEEILARAALEALPILRAVSKSLKTLIDSPGFKHLRSSLRRPTQYIFLDNYVKNIEAKIYAAESLHSPEIMKATTELCNLPFHTNAYKFWVSCNGLVCGSNCSDMFVLWNPNTNQHLELPIRVVHPYGQEICSGFDYDAAHDDYKVVTLGQLGGYYAKPFQHNFTVYSLKSNSWSNLPVCQLPYIMPRTSSDFIGMFTNNALHWLMFANYERTRVIVALDLTTEKYHLVLLPQFEDGTMGMIENENVSLHILDGCLCLTDSRSSEQADMWMMMKYGAKNSWTKLRLQFPGGKLSGVLIRDLRKLKPMMYSRGSGNTHVIFQYDQYLIWYDIKEGLNHHIVETWAGNTEGHHIVSYSRLIVLGASARAIGI